VILAFNGWCAAGLLDATGPHFSQALLPRIEIKKYRDGTVIWVQNFLKSDVQATPADEEAAVAFLSGPLPPGFDVRGGSLALFPPAWEVFLPLKKGAE